MSSDIERSKNCEKCGNPMLEKENPDMNLSHIPSLVPRAMRKYWPLSTSSIRNPADFDAVTDEKEKCPDSFSENNEPNISASISPVILENNSAWNDDNSSESNPLLEPDSQNLLSEHILELHTNSEVAPDIVDRQFNELEFEANLKSISYQRNQAAESSKNCIISFNSSSQCISYLNRERISHSILYKCTFELNIFRNWINQMTYLTLTNMGRDGNKSFDAFFQNINTFDDNKNSLCLSMLNYINTLPSEFIEQIFQRMSKMKSDSTLLSLPSIKLAWETYDISKKMAASKVNVKQNRRFCSRGSTFDIRAILDKDISESITRSKFLNIYEVPIMLKSLIKPYSQNLEFERTKSNEQNLNLMQLCKLGYMQNCQREYGLELDQEERTKNSQEEHIKSVSVYTRSNQDQNLKVRRLSTIREKGPIRIQKNEDLISGIGRTNSELTLPIKRETAELKKETNLNGGKRRSGNELTILSKTLNNKYFKLNKKSIKGINSSKLISKQENEIVCNHSNPASMNGTETRTTTQKHSETNDKQLKDENKFPRNPKKIISRCKSNIIQPTRFEINSFKNPNNTHAHFSKSDWFSMDKPVLLKYAEGNTGKSTEILLYAIHSMQAIIENESCISQCTIFEKLLQSSRTYTGKNPICVLINPRKVIKTLRAEELASQNIIPIHTSSGTHNLLKTECKSNANVLPCASNEEWKYSSGFPYCDLHLKNDECCKIRTHGKSKQNQFGMRSRKHDAGSTSDPLSPSNLQRKKLIIRTCRRKKSRTALKRINIRKIVTSFFKNAFRSFSLLGGHLRSGAVITKSNSNYWLRKAGLASDSHSLAVASELFQAVAGTKIVLNIYDYMKFLIAFARWKRMIVPEVVKQLMLCKLPSRVKNKNLGSTMKGKKTFLCETASKEEISRLSVRINSRSLPNLNLI
ncbi:uncharacterized protein LOC118182771 [Stegodyphus dumicola]|uniref:uncharacterized protein LOC118182771 n=1 Tax=Stegodyphus dumicola TaxID=202533 RepID=UPI0015B0F0F6|nr:uncharacterized protein LOC118182771 [Stegodyphus dumicola]